MADPDLASLVARARKGDRPAFEKVVQRTTRIVYAQIIASVRDRQRAEDLTQETFVSAWKGIGSIGSATSRAAEARGPREEPSAVPRAHGSPEKAGKEIAGGGTRDAAAGFITWLLTVARNVTLDALKFESRQKRDASRQAAGSAEEDLSATGQTPHESAELTEAREHALRVLEELPEEYRRVLSLRYLGGADYQTIRAQLELSDGALRGLLNRGMALMRERMGILKM